VRALVVDDDIPTTQAIRDSVDWKAFFVSEVFIAHNIGAAKKLIIEYLPEIIVCDIEMPKGSGIDLIKWVRERGLESRFIFLTCHEDFIYASEAIKYAADAYVTKPFDVKNIQDVLAKAAEKTAYQRQLRQYQDYGERWMSNLHTRENSFWREMLFGSIPQDIRSIETEIESRGIGCDASKPYRLLLCSARESQLEENGRNKSTFRFSLCRLVNEVIANKPDIVCTLDYTANGCIYVIKVMQADDDPATIAGKCEELIGICRDAMQCELTCYISDAAAIDSLAASRISLEELDAYNISKRGRAVSGIADTVSDAGPYTFDSAPIKRLIREESGVEAVNMLRHELDTLAAQDRLNSENMHRIQHDYMQIVYSILYDNNVQAHELFADAASQKLYHASGYSAFDMMKWASYITSKTFQHIREVRETETVVNKLKRFIAENYSKKLTREEIASSVFLSSDYVSKIFRNETGLYIKDYLNEVRIGKAKHLIREGRMNVSEAASLVGFDNFSYFSSLFKKSTGVSPSEYRKQEAN
jgi:two-component system response regulator YesN